jgi:hypothetical protein
VIVANQFTRQKVNLVDDRAIASDTQRADGDRTQSFMIKPMYQLDQKVGFIGGSGWIKHYYSEAETWMYVIEMKPDLDQLVNQIGQETTVVLEETEIYGLMNDYLPQVLSTS